MRRVIHSTTRRIARVAALSLVAVAVATAATTAQAAYDPGDPAQKAQHDAAQAIGTQAYQYGLPLLDMQRTFDTSTSVNVPNGRGGGPVNRFSHFLKLADARDRTVVVPNADTLYSMAWLDLRKQPQVIHTKKGTKRFHVLELLDPYTENFVNIGSPRKAKPDGDYLLTGPGFSGRTPQGLKRIRAPYDRVWVIGRTYVDGKADLPATHRVQSTYRITPLNRWDRTDPYAYSPKAPRPADRTVNEAHMPGTAAGEDALTWYDALGVQLKRFPPPAADRPVLASLATLGIGAGKRPTSDATLTDAQRQGLRDAVTGGPAGIRAELVSRYLKEFDIHNGWLVGDVGTYGTNYALRAIADQFGLGAPRPEVSVYPLAFLDGNKASFTGASRYVAHFAPGTAPPPVQFFWSLTMYDNDGFLVRNPLDRYLVNDRSTLHYNADRSLDIYIQPDAPTDPAQRANWLPSPQPTAAQPGFRLMMRLYGLSATGITGAFDGTGFRAPMVLPCLPTGATAQGVACAK